MSKKKAVICIVLVVLLVIVAVFVRKICLINRIIKNVGANSKITNYKTFWEDSHYAYAFATDGKTVSNSIGGKYGDDSNVCYYRNENSSYIINLTNKTYHEYNGEPMYSEDYLTDGIYENMSFKDKIVAVFTWKIRSEKLGDKECYYVCKDINKVQDGEEFEFWLDKGTYFKVKATKKEDLKKHEPADTVYYFSTEVNKVTDTDLFFPNLDEYTRIK